MQYAPPEHLRDQVRNGREAFKRQLECIRARSVPKYAALTSLFNLSNSPGKSMLAAHGVLDEGRACQ